MGKKTLTKLLAILLAFTIFSITGCSNTQKSASTGNTTVTGEFVNLNEPKEENLLTVEKIKNYHLYGYKVLDFGYIDPEGVADFPILDEKKYNPLYYDVSSDRSSDVFYSFSYKASEFYKSFNGAADFSYNNVAFSGKVSEEFNTSSETSEKQQFIKYIQYHTIYESHFKGNDENLQSMLSEDFKNALVKNKNNPGKIFEDYGTHLFTKYYMGGRADLNFTYTNSESKTDSEIRTSVDAAYGQASGSASADDKKKAKLVLQNSTLHFESYGGDSLTGSSVDAISKQFQGWVKTIENNPNICKIGSFNDSLKPLWELFDEGSEYYNILKNEFDKQAASRQVTLDNLNYYISDIIVISDSSKKAALAKIPKEYSFVCLNPGTDSIDPLECNHNAGGDFVYIAYRMSTDKSKAIIDIAVASGKKTAFSGYHKIDLDLNRGAGGDFIYLFYRKATKSDLNNEMTKYIKGISGFYGKANVLPDGWQWPSHTVDLNRSAGGSYIYLAVEKN